MAQRAKTINAQNLFTGSISSRYKNLPGWMNISIKDNTTGNTITLQRHLPEDAAGVWRDVEQWTTNVETGMRDDMKGVIYRLGCKTGDYVSGTPIVELNREGDV
jgi:hypothetical protein